MRASLRRNTQDSLIFLCFNAHNHTELEHLHINSQKDHDQVYGIKIRVCGDKYTEPFNPDFDLAIGVVQRVEPALHQQGPLEAEGCDQEVKTHCAETVALQKCHQEAKPNKYHYMDILETYKTERREGCSEHCSEPVSNGSHQGDKTVKGQV